MSYEHYEQYNLRLNRNKPDEDQAYKDLERIMKNGGFVNTKGETQFKQFVLSVISDYKNRGKSPPKTTSNSQILSLLMGLDSKLERALEGGFISNEERQSITENVQDIRRTSELSDDVIGFITNDDE